MYRYFYIVTNDNIFTGKSKRIKYTKNLAIYGAFNQKQLHIFVTIYAFGHYFMKSAINRSATGINTNKIVVFFVV